MSKAVFTILAGAFFGLCSLAQSPDEQTGAKALFLNSITNEQSPSPSGEKPSAPSDGKRHSPTAAATKTELPAVTGMMYYVELLRPDGELSRVNSDHIFHSGDRIRIHVQSNIDGSLVVYQSEDGSEPQVLFPAGKLSGVSGRVTRGMDVVIPSPKAWFKFDEHPGQILLTLALSAKGAQKSNDAKPAPSRENEVLMADASSVQDLHKAQEGSKALVVETDDSPSEPSKIAVIDSRRDSKIPPGQIAVKITLIHHS